MPIPIKRFKRKSNPLYKKYKKRRSMKPTRFRGARVSTRYKTALSVSKMLSNYGENKFNGNIFHCLAGTTKPAGAQPLSYHLINLSKDIRPFLGNQWSNHLDLYNFPLGDDSNQRQGRYMYLRNTTLKMEIQMHPILDVANPSIFNNLNNAYEFRLLVIRAKRKYQQYGDSDDLAKPSNSLFLDKTNTSFGLSDLSHSTFEYMNQMVNKRQWSVVKDTRFTLSPPSVELRSGNDSANSTNVCALRYPIKKKIDCYIPFNRKSYFNNDAVDPTENIPTNIDTQTLVILQACRAGYCATGTTAPNTQYYSMTIQGTTTARDS